MATTKPEPQLLIEVDRKSTQLVLSEAVPDGRRTLMSASIVSGCGDSATPPGNYKGGGWKKDKTSPVHGPTPWSKDPWANPYGPYFLPLNDARTGVYTTYGIHGTRGPMAGNFVKPPLPEWMVQRFMDDSQARYLYCSHGCIRVSNQNITKLFQVTTQPRLMNTTLYVVIT